MQGYIIFASLGFDHNILSQNLRDMSFHHFEEIMTPFKN